MSDSNEKKPRWYRSTIIEWLRTKAAYYKRSDVGQDLIALHLEDAALHLELAENEKATILENLASAQKFWSEEREDNARLEAALRKVADFAMSASNDYPQRRVATDDAIDIDLLTQLLDRISADKQVTHGEISEAAKAVVAAESTIKRLSQESQEKSDRINELESALEPLIDLTDKLTRDHSTNPDELCVAKSALDDGS